MKSLRPIVAHPSHHQPPAPSLFLVFNLQGPCPCAQKKEKGSLAPSYKKKKHLVSKRKLTD